ncbi:hypothetical protein WICPIJ_006936 [Wickerhamomyces pijperi]|uniref:AMP-dependent synthetase/ligase domain-containing protein n=1 Tax=Wickerhamomyces pijperi TaxID=599730 RepID=A0A9P8TKJ1_WICPI|nr:hypothetical protein WICPIJ_006936 [Wickerhamomyces pijperi]
MSFICSIFSVLLHYVVLPFVALYILLIIYHEYLSSQRDIQDLALLNQSNIAATRKSNETAIYRNNQTPHGLPLVTGLAVRDGFKLRDGNLRDWWSVLIAQEKKKESPESDRVIVEDSKTGTMLLSMSQIQTLSSQLSSYFKGKEYTVIGSVLPLFSYHSLLLSLACFSTNGLTYHHFIDFPRTQPEEVDVMVCYKSQLTFVQRLKYKLIIVIDSESTSSGIVSWDQIISEPTPTAFEHTHDPKETLSYPFRQTTSLNATHSYTHQNFVSSCASMVKSLPMAHELTSNDTIMITQGNDLTQWGKFMAALIVGGKVILGDSDDKEVIDSWIEKYQPSIISVNEKYVTNTVNSYDQEESKKSGVAASFNSLILSRAIHMFSEGIFTSSAQQSSLFNSLRLTYITHHIATNDPASNLTSSDLTKYRAITSSRAIQTTSLPPSTGGLLSHIFQTNYYDYRILSTDKLRNLGTVTLTLELKLRAVPGLDIEQDKAGEVCIRGFVVGTPYGEKALGVARKDGEEVGGEGWCPLRGVRGRFGIDGCFYEG